MNYSKLQHLFCYNPYALQILSGTLGKEPYYYGPLYFYFLALVYKIFGIDPYIARLIQMLLGIATSLLIYLIARKVFNKTTALISISISIFYGMFYIHEGVLLMESLVTFLNTLSIFLLLRIENNPSYKNIALAGITIGLSALARANILLFVPFILIWIFFNSKLITHNSKLLRFAFLCLVILLTISPATIRNYLVSGKFVLISTNGPVNLWIGNNPYATGEFYYPPSFYGDKVAEVVKEKGEMAYIEAVVRFFREKPIAFLSLQIKKFLLFWDKHEIENNVNYSLQKGYSSLFRLPIFLGFGLIGPFALFGILLSLRRPKCLLLQLAVLSFMIATVLFFITARYRLSIIPIFCLFSSIGIWWLCKKMYERRYKVLSLSLIPLAASFFLCHYSTIHNRLYPLSHPDGFHIKSDDRIIIKDNIGSTGADKVSLATEQDVIKKGLVINEDISRLKEVGVGFNFSAGEGGFLSLEVNDRYAAPIKPMNTGGLMAWTEAIFPSAAFHKGMNSIFIRQLKEGDTTIAIDTSCSFSRSWFKKKEGRWKRLNKGEYMVWLTLYPDSKRDWAQEYYNRGKSFFNEGLYKEAEGQLKKALEADPKRYEAYRWFGLCYEAEKEFEKAIGVYRMGLSILTDKNSLIELHNNLARLYYEKGMIDDAIEETKKIIAIDPKNIQAHNNLIGLQKLPDKN